MRPAKTQISLGIHPVWSQSSLSAWRKLGSLAIHWAHGEDADQTGQVHQALIQKNWRLTLNSCVNGAAKFSKTNLISVHSCCDLNSWRYLKIVITSYWYNDPQTWATRVKCSLSASLSKLEVHALTFWFVLAASYMSCDTKKIRTSALWC